MRRERGGDGGCEMRGGGRRRVWGRGYVRKKGDK